MIAGIVLAAGTSSRMGSPKALLDYRGETFLERIVARLRDGGCEPVVVVTGPGDDEIAARVADHARAAGATAVVNPVRGSQQIDSLRIALRSLPEPTGGAVVTPVDAPGVSAEVVAALASRIAEGHPVAIPTFGGRRGHPVAFGGPAIPALLDGDLPEGARSVIQRFANRVAEVACDDPAVLLDVDTPEDYRALRGRGR